MYHRCEGLTIRIAREAKDEQWQMLRGLDAGLAELLEELVAGGPVEASAHVRDDRVEGLVLRLREAVLGQVAMTNRTLSASRDRRT
jgi:hypothetical protein